MKRDFEKKIFEMIIVTSIEMLIEKTFQFETYDEKYQHQMLTKIVAFDY